ncbi:MAG: hypothetical protein K0R26_2707 [Bacteroidota bacterium]|jgi:predicted DNA-binding protein (MmcQ/YjbR family)|nr:hypothetical protein [Bacteroidota bacterium]
MVTSEQFTRLALSFDDTEESAHFKKTSFRVNKKIFATLDEKQKKAVIKLSDVHQSVFGSLDPAVIYPVKGSWGKQGWSEINLTKVKKSVLTDALKLSYENVAPKKSQLKICDKGHEFYKSSSCPVCPICEKNKKPLKGFLSQLSAPARRALENAGIKTPAQLRKKTEKELLALHGMGPGSIPKIRAILASQTEKNNTIKHVPKQNDLKKGVNEVSDFIQKLDPRYKEIMTVLRRIILGADTHIQEQIKWNVPSFFYTGEMKPFNPKEYKRDLIVTNIRQKDHLLLILPSGAKLNGCSPILEGDYNDGRRMIKIYDLQDLKIKTKEIQKVIKKWLSLIDK